MARGAWWRAIVATAALLATAAAPAAGAPTTTVERTIQDCDGDNLLEWAPGEPHANPSSGDAPACEPARAGGRLQRPRTDSILNFLHLSDFQMVDEESPGRVEFLDTTQRPPGLNPFAAAYRPMEALTTQVTEAMVRQARNTTSPITGAPLELAIVTGDNADSQQHNETRWFIDILDGTVGSGNPDPEMDPSADRKIIPDSGVEAAVASCQLPPGLGYVDNGSPYDGVRGGGRPGQDTGYYEPDGEGDGDGYTPDRERNQAEVPGPHADVTVRDFPGLLEQAQQPFEAVGLGMPWYSAFGNHDALVQGNSPGAYFGPSALTGNQEAVDPAYDAIVRGCLKPSKLPAGVTAEQYLEQPDRLLALADPLVVPPDPRRCHLPKDAPAIAAAPCDTGGWIQQHSRTTGVPVGHGFEPFQVGDQTGEGRPAPARANRDGYYAFSPSPGIRFVVLDTVTDECGELVCSEGSVDDPQFQWAERELAAADAAGEIVLAFSHHTLRTTRMPSVDPGEQPIHYGERFDRSSDPPQPVRPDAAPGTTLEDLFCRHPSLVAHVNGHEHANHVIHHRCEDPGQGANAFWEISTAAHIDWPQQARMLELLDLDGRLVIVGTIIDHAGPAEPATGAASDQPLRLAGIARELAFNDYQHSRGARGDRGDRNVILDTGRPTPPRWR